MGVRLADRPAVEMTMSGGHRQQPGDRAQERALAGAVGADDGDRLALVDLDVDVEQRLEVAIEGVERARPQAGSWQPAMPM